MTRHLRRNLWRVSCFSSLCHNLETNSAEAGPRWQGGKVAAVCVMACYALYVSLCVAFVR